MFAGYHIDVSIDSEEGQLFAKGHCPICDTPEDSADHGFGQDHAFTITMGKVKTHMRIVHKISDPEDAKAAGDDADEDEEVDEKKA